MRLPALFLKREILLFIRALMCVYVCVCVYMCVYVCVCVCVCVCLFVYCIFDRSKCVKI
jgi:hypothetical protein